MKNFVFIIFFCLYSCSTFHSFIKKYETHPSLQNLPYTTWKKKGVPGDPLNIGLVGTKKEIIHALITAGWVPADSITFRHAVHIVESVVLKLPYPTAPVSNLYLWNRKEDVAFEQPVGKSPRSRHHVRFWKSDSLSIDGRSIWLGAATFDTKIEFRARQFEITHHINPDIDSERDKIIEDLKNAGQLIRTYQLPGIGTTLNGHNGEGDFYFTDGEMIVGVLTALEIPEDDEYPPDAPD